MISLLKRLVRACLPARGGTAAGESIIAEIQEHFREALAAETALAYRHQSDPYYTSSRGHNVGQDEMLAVIYAEKIVLAPGAAESGDPVSYANRLLGDLEAIKAEYRISEDDPDGYGIGTLHSISRKLEPFARGALVAFFGTGDSTNGIRCICRHCEFGTGLGADPDE